MKLLIFTQKVDRTDSILGFFHTWLVEIAQNAESVTVICLEKGDYSLPKNVVVHSLGKENGSGKLGQLINLYKYVLLIKGSYDRVFVHMNQEYVLLCGLYWRLKKIPVYLWRNHPSGSLATRLAVLLSTKVFCTSKDSFTARFRKTILMPAGIDLKLFAPVSGVVRKKYSVCVVGRISPVKHTELALEALRIFVSGGGQISLDIIGGVSERDKKYYDFLKRYVTSNNLSNVVHFLDAVSQDKLPEIYSSYEVCLNLTISGSFDKTIVEASACGAIPLVSNSSLAQILPNVCITNSDPDKVADSLRKLMEVRVQVDIQNELKRFSISNGLSTLIVKLFEEMR